MHVHDRFRSLAGRFSTYLLAFACTKQEYYLCIQILKPKLFQMSPLYIPICGITLPFQVNLHVPPLKIQMNICFVCLDRSWSDRGWSVSSMLSGLFSWLVFVGGGGVNFTFIAWEPPLMCSAWKILKTLGRDIDRKGVPPKIIFISDSSFELWHLCKSLLPSVKGQSIYF